MSKVQESQSWALDRSTDDCVTAQATDAAAAFDDAGLQDSDESFPVLQNRDIGQNIAVHDQHVAQFSDSQCS